MRFLLFITQTIFLFNSVFCQISINLETIDSLNSVASNLVFENSDSARQLAFQLRDFSVNEKLKFQKANALHTIGLSYHVEGKLELAIEQYNKAIEIRGGTKDELKNAGLYNNIASIFVQKGDYTRALSLYQKALSLKQKSNDEKGVANTLNNIGIIYYESKDYEQAVYYYQQALEKRLSINLLDAAAATYGNLGLLYLDQNEFNKAIEFYKKGLNLTKEDTIHVCNKIYLENGMGLTYLKSGNIELAEVFSSLAYEHALQCNDPTIEASSLNSLGRINLKKGILNVASEQLHKAYKIGKDNNLNSRLLEYTESLYEYYLLIDQSDEALKYFKEYVELEDSIKNEDVVKELTTLELTYLFEKEKDSIQFAQQKEILTYEADAEKTRVIQNYTYIVLALAVALTSILFFAYYNKQKSNRQLSEKNEIISESLNEKELLIREIHHRVKNNLQIINSMLNIQQKTSTNEHTREQFQNAKNRVLAMSMVHNSLFNSNQVNQIDTSIYLVDLIETLASALCPENVELSHNIESIRIDSNLAINVGLLINELVTNSCKYGFPNNESGFINVIFTKENSTFYTLKIDDSGVGYDTSIKRNSFGLNMVKSVVNSLVASIKIDTNKGTSVNVKIPIADV